MKYQSNELARFSHQLSYAHQNYKPHGHRVSAFKGIVIGGLGGSGIAGRIVASYLQNISPVPIEIVSDYQLPAWADNKTLVISSSYSGNTEETLYMFEDGLQRSCPSLVLTTGGTLGEKASAMDIPVYYAEKGYQPRMALGYSLTYLIKIFEELLGIELIGDIKGLIESLEKTDEFKNRAEGLFKKFEEGLNKKFVIVTDGSTSAAGVRFCQQIQENAKGEAFQEEIPEANHNAIESLYGPTSSNFIFLNGNIHERVSLRFDYLRKVVQKTGDSLYELTLNGRDLRQIIETIYVLDWLSLMIADAKEVNSVRIDNIEGLKKFLSDH